MYFLHPFFFYLTGMGTLRIWVPMQRSKTDMQNRRLSAFLMLVEKPSYQALWMPTPIQCGLEIGCMNLPWRSEFLFIIWSVEAWQITILNFIVIFEIFKKRLGLFTFRRITGSIQKLQINSKLRNWKMFADSDFATKCKDHMKKSHLTILFQKSYVDLSRRYLDFVIEGNAT